MSKSLCDSRRMDCGQTQGQCPSLSPRSHSIIGKEKWKSISYAVMNGPTFLISLPCACCLPVLFFTTEVKGRRTGRSRYLCGTRSVATGWETTSISTCTSARLLVGMGGSTHLTKSPLTVRNQASLFFLFYIGSKMLKIKRQLFLVNIYISISYNHFHFVYFILSCLQRDIRQIFSRPLHCFFFPDSQETGILFISYSVFGLSATLCWLNDILLLTRWK